MKQQLIKYHLTFAIILFSMIANAQWTHLTSPTSNDLFSVYFPDTNTGYTVGIGDTVYKTTNAGINWIPLPVGTTTSYPSFSSVYFTSVDTGYIAGYHTLAKTNNGGISWHPLLNDTTYELFSIFFISPSTGFVTGSNGTGQGIILKTTNRGASWTLQTFTSYLTLTSIVFTDSLNGHIVGGNGIMLRTTDGGTNWTPQIGACQFRSTYFPSPSIGYALGTSPSLMKTIDGGITWDTLTCYTNSNFSVLFTSVDTGYVASGGGSGHIMKTLDGGLTWHTQPSGTNFDIHSLYFTDANTGYAVCKFGHIMKTTNGGSNSFLGIEVNENSNEINIFPNPSTALFIIHSEARINQIKIFNIIGEVIKTITNTETIDLTDQSNGIYFAEIKTEKGIINKKIILQ